MNRQTILTSLFCLSGFGVAHAGIISLSAPFTDDLSTGISSSNIYTHAVSGGSAQTVNGVNFELLNPTTTPANFNWDTGGLNKNQVLNNNGDWLPAGAFDLGITAGASTPNNKIGEAVLRVLQIRGIEVDAA